VVARAVGALALAALAVIHVVDLPGTLGPTPLVGAGYLAIIAAAVVTGGVMITRTHWLAWAAAAAVLADSGSAGADYIDVTVASRPAAGAGSDTASGSSSADSQASAAGTPGAAGSTASTGSPSSG